jgi:hypothetical protein
MTLADEASMSSPRKSCATRAIQLAVTFDGADQR